MAHVRLVLPSIGVVQSEMRLQIPSIDLVISEKYKLGENLTRGFSARRNERRVKESLLVVPFGCRLTV